MMAKDGKRKLYNSPTSSTYPDGGIVGPIPTETAIPTEPITKENEITTGGTPDGGGTSSNVSTPYLQPHRSAFDLTSPPSLSNSLYPVFNPTLHLNYRNSNLIKSINISHVLNINNAEHTLEMIGDGSFPLFNQSCIEIMKWELINYINTIHSSKHSKCNKYRSRICFESPKLRDCKDLLPFVYQAWTNESTLKAISAISGFDLKVCLDYEIAHFAKNIPKINNNQHTQLRNQRFNSRILHPQPQYHSSKRQKINVSSSSSSGASPLIMRKNSIAYPYICLVKVFSTSSSTSLYHPTITTNTKSPESRPLSRSSTATAQQHSPPASSSSSSPSSAASLSTFDNSLPEGYAVVLQGRVTENMAYRTLSHFKKQLNGSDQRSSSSKSNQFNIMLCATFQPVDLIKYEDLKFINNYSISSAQRLICDTTKLSCGLNTDPHNSNVNSNADNGVHSPIKDYSEFDNFDKYKDWLDGFYSGKQPGTLTKTNSNQTNKNAKFSKGNNKRKVINQSSLKLTYKNDDVKLKNNSLIQKVPKRVGSLLNYNTTISNAVGGVNDSTGVRNKEKSNTLGIHLSQQERQQLQLQLQQQLQERTINIDDVVGCSEDNDSDNDKDDEDEERLHAGNVVSPTLSSSSS